MCMCIFCHFVCVFECLLSVCIVLPAYVSFVSLQYVGELFFVHVTLRKPLCVVSTSDVCMCIFFVCLLMDRASRC